MRTTKVSRSNSANRPPGRRRAAASEGWHREDVKAAVRKRGCTLADLSRRHGFAPEAASIALRRPWGAIERIIAKFLGVEPRDIWPERYTEDGEKKSRRKGAVS
jgi:Ner family transcriptional regulator